MYCLPSPLPIGPEDDVEVGGDEEDSIFPKLLFCENETIFSVCMAERTTADLQRTVFTIFVTPSHRPKVEGGRYFSKIHSATACEDEESNEQGPRTPFPEDASSSFVNPNKKGTKGRSAVRFRERPLAMEAAPSCV